MARPSATTPALLYLGHPCPRSARLECNTRGDVAGLIYPSTHSIGFDPNAYGEPRQVRHLPSGVEYAKSASYNQYGGMAGFTYGSTATRTITPNLRGMNRPGFQGGSNS